MRLWKIIFWILGAFIVLAGIAYIGWLLFMKMNSKSESPLKAIPQNTALILKINNPHAFWMELNQNNLIWKQLVLLPSLKELSSGINRIDSMLKSDEKLSVMLRNHPVYLALTVKGRYEPVWMFIVQLSGYAPSDAVTDFIGKQFGDKAIIHKVPYGTSDLIRVIVRGEKEPFYFAVGKGVLVASTRPDLVSKSIDQISLNLPSVSGTGFRNVESISGKKVNANIYINYRILPPFLSRYLKEGNNFDAEKQRQFADWSGLDIIVKKDELLMNGFTTLSDTLGQYLSVFLDQVPQKIRVTGILPGNTSSFVYAGTDAPARYHQNLAGFIMEKAPYLREFRNLTNLEERSSISMKDYFLPWTGNEIVSVSVSATIEGDPDNEYAVIAASDAHLADSLLKDLAGITGNRPDSVNYEDHVIRQLHLQDIIPYIWGPFFRMVHGSCYVNIDGYIVFGNDVTSVKEFLKQVTSGNILSKDRDFASFSENIPDNSNLYLYSNNSRSLNAIRDLLQDNIYDEIEPSLDSLKKLDQFGLQLSNREGIFYTNFFTRYNPNPGEKGPMEWQVALDTVLYGKPQLIPVDRQGHKEVIAFDHANQIYIIDSLGNIRWKLKLPGQVMGPVVPVFSEGSDSCFFLLNTPTHLCLISQNGNFAKGYPVAFPARAVAAFSPFDPGTNPDQRYLIPLSNRKIYAFRPDGKPPKLAMSPGFKEDIASPVSVISYGGRNYYFIRGKSGSFLITDSRGKSLIRTPKMTLSGGLSEFYINRTNKKGSFLTTDPAGKVLYIGMSGKTAEATFNLFSPAHRFFYLDLNNDGAFEFIFYDQNKIYYYNRFYKMIYSYVFTRELSIPPFMIRLPDGSYRIGAVSGSADELYLFGDKGLITLEPGIRGNSFFDIGTADGKAPLLLVTATGKYLKCYRLTQP